MQPTAPQPAPVNRIDWLKLVAADWAYDAQHYAQAAAHADCPDRQTFEARALACWRRRRDRECAVSRMLNDGRPRHERVHGSSTWTVGGAS